jgi:hypothetical protein
LEAVIPVLRCGTGDQLGSGELQQDVPDEMAVQARVEGLVAVAEEAIVAGDGTLVGPGRVLLAGLSVEVADPERLARYGGKD